MTAVEGRRRARAAGVGWLVAGALWPAVAGGGPAPMALQGAALWSGDRPLQARIAGHDQTLPPVAARCINCHGGTVNPSTEGVGSAPSLTARYLREPLARRGGPSSRYDVAAFCTLLRTGVDPSAVLLPRHMPRYTVSDADCQALWAHLTGGAA